MFFDQQNSVFYDGMYAYPDWVFSAQPRQLPVEENPIITGSSTGTSLSITGSVDSKTLSGH